MRQVLSAAVLVSLLASCGQTVPDVAVTLPGDSLVGAYAERPELQDPESQAILSRYANDPGLVQALQEAYGERPTVLSFPETPTITGQDLAADRLAYIKRVGWRTVTYYNGQYASYAGTTLPYSGLNWTRDGCSAPDGLGLGYREDFRPACNVHDFAYRNLKVYQRTDANRKTSDDVFYSNMKVICAAKSWYAEPACYSAAYAYYQGVRVGGGGSF
ncbi:phospholipase A2 [Deinococcus deserti]|uniref:Putative phospholipase A2 n=1 Tax=Deinococcus deserti (strain DSM 17065 / CIP 109153 / LMG 22923 / VCD115) TaxID=546414 RepID=C1D474_DEIDV|nr:phospholipase A2 [Deinococcus deserti]ACO47955.1 putative phospholipase A2, precursor [Deinococcus deserti VCD115]